MLDYLSVHLSLNTASNELVKGAVMAEKIEKGEKTFPL